MGLCCVGAWACGARGCGKITNAIHYDSDQLRATLEEMKAADERMQSMLDSYVEETSKALEALKADIEGES